MVNGKPAFKPEVQELLNKDRSAFDKKYGASFTFWMLMDTNMNLQWAPPSVEPYKQPEDWTKGKTKGFSQYDNIKPTGTSAEGIASGQIDKIWGKTLPKLLLASQMRNSTSCLLAFWKIAEKQDMTKLWPISKKPMRKTLRKLNSSPNDLIR